MCEPITKDKKALVQDKDIIRLLGEQKKRQHGQVHGAVMKAFTAKIKQSRTL
jgi:hypothetical protein